MRVELGDGLVVGYEEVGEGRPVVFLHGWGGSLTAERADFEPVFAERRGWRRIYLDLPGAPRTPTVPWITDQDGILDAVLRFLDRVVPGERLVLVGTSAGGYLARGVLLRRFDQVDGVLLRVPGVIMDRARRTLPPRTVLVEDPALMATLDPREAEEWGDLLVQTPAYLEALRATERKRQDPEAARTDEEFLTAIGADPARYAFSFDVDALLPPFPGPSLILTGRQDEVCGYRDPWSLLEKFPRATFAVLDRADHGLPVDQEPLFAALVEDWLRRLTEYAGTGP
ncbi:MAG: alpha/beta fold hydrolase [Mycobacteriales bacterium]